MCKDSPHAFREYQIQKDSLLLEEIYDRWNYTQLCLNEDREPDIDYVPEPLLLNRGDSVFDEIIATDSPPEK